MSLSNGPVPLSPPPATGGAFVIRRDMTTGNPLWTVRTDYPAIDLDADADTAYVAYRDGEILALGLEDGSVRQRWRLRGLPGRLARLRRTASAWSGR
jgi:hypothetical protein